jgi:hypothetical protein
MELGVEIANDTDLDGVAHDGAVLLGKVFMGPS